VGASLLQKSQQVVNIWALRLIPPAAIAVLVLGLLGLPHAEALSVDGHVRGGGERFDLTVVAIGSRNLHESAVLGSATVDSETGAFSLAAPGAERAWLMVVGGCDAAAIAAGRFLQCDRYLPRHAPVEGVMASVVLQIPDLDVAQAVWRGERAPAGPIRPIALGLIACVLVIGVWLRRAAPVTAGDVASPSEPAPTWAPAALIAVAAVLLSFGLGTQPLDLLEYSYFHEGVRPASYGAVLADATSAELAHGPVMPLILRACAAVSPSPWVLRLPSALFGLAFIVVVLLLARRALGELGGAAVTATAVLSPVALYYSRDATPYALAGLCAAASLLLLLHARETRRPLLLWSGFAALQVLGFFSHYGYAFAALAMFVGVCVVWRGERRLLSNVLLASGAAAILPALVAPSLLHMVSSSGIRFALMSPVYPQSPGLLGFGAAFLTVLTGLPTAAPWALVLSLAVWGAGIRLLWARSRLLAAVVGSQALFIVLFLVFSHTMSTAVGGEKVFYAYRWTRPLLLGLVVPLGAAALTRARWGLVVLLAIAGWQCALVVFVPARPAQDAVVAHIAANVQPGDAYAVLPAAFYGDPLQYHLADGDLAGSQLLTRMQTRDLPVGNTVLRGPIMESVLPLETAVDRLQYRRLWVVVYREAMFGTRKFDPGVGTRTIAWLDGRFSRVDAQAFDFVDLYLYTCDADCAWRGAQKLVIRPDDRLQLDRYLIQPPGFPMPAEAGETVDLAVPMDASAVNLLIAGASAPDRVTRGAQGVARVDLSGVDRSQVVIEVLR